MIVLGLSGGCATEMQREWDAVGEAWAHDGAAVLIADGKVIAGVEEERLNRIKHSWLFPAEASRWCLQHAGIAIGEVDAIAFARAETDLDGWLGGAGSARELLGKRLHGLFGDDVRGKLHFVDRLQAHADSAFPYAGGDDALVLVLDGAGEFASGQENIRFVPVRARLTGGMPALNKPPAPNAAVAAISAEDNPTL